MCDAMGIMGRSNEAEIRNRFSLTPEMPLIKASDAHAPQMIGEGCTIFEMENLSFEEIKKALGKIDGRKTYVE